MLLNHSRALKTVPISAEISAREKSMAATIFAEVVKNLEIAKSILSQETPAIQIIDQSTLPLEKIKSNKIKLIILWGCFLSISYIFFTVFSKWIKNTVKENHPN